MYLLHLSSPARVSSAAASQAGKPALRAWRTALSFALCSRIACMCRAAAAMGGDVGTGRPTSLQPQNKATLTDCKAIAEDIFAGLDKCRRCINAYQICYIYPAPANLSSAIVLQSWKPALRAWRTAFPFALRSRIAYIFHGAPATGRGPGYGEA